MQIQKKYLGAQDRMSKTQNRLPYCLCSVYNTSMLLLRKESLRVKFEIGTFSLQQVGALATFFRLAKCYFYSDYQQLSNCNCPQIYQIYCWNRAIHSKVVSKRKPSEAKNRQKYTNSWCLWYPVTFEMYLQDLQDLLER